MFKITHTSFVQNIFHADLKIDQKLFKKIKKYSIKRYKDLNTTFYETLPEDLRNEIINYLNNYVIEVGKLLDKKRHIFQEIWIQKYGIADYHNIHLHQIKKAAYSFVLYIDGGAKSGSTRFYNLGYPYVYYDRYLDSKPVPGKCVIFFGALPHESVPSRDNKKIIVSGNIEYS
tara:strand:- start:1882 stop:2400 length:519 start_codon:yes stop_codon:yes gene_type:complete